MSRRNSRGTCDSKNDVIPRPDHPILVGMGILFVMTVLLSLTPGCASVRRFEREHLADPIMAFERNEREASRELHWLEAREGATGGTGGAGGGCACN